MGSGEGVGQFEKHGVSFEEAAIFFEDLNLLEVPDEERSTQERRMLLIGRSQIKRTLLVVFTERRAGQAEVVRIISAWRANKREREFYENFVR